MRSTASRPFRRRHYHSAAQLWHDLRQLAALRAQPHAAVSPALRERLMLVATSVNQCRYCAVFHTRAAQLSGIMPSEIALLLGGALQHAPEFELPALLYARSWAEAAGAPDRNLTAQLVARYGSDLAAGIELMLRAIQIGNLLGNTGDYLLFRISGGRLGQARGIWMIDHFDALAPLYDRLIGPPDPARLRALLDLPAGGWVLDAGGGTGRIAAQLRELTDNLVLLDRSQPMLRQAQSKGLWPIQGDVARLPFPDACFDRAVVVDALHHFPDQSAAIGELLRVLKPGGRLVIEEPDIARVAVKLVALAERLALMGSSFSSPPEMCAMAVAHGAQARVVSDGGFAAWVVAEKRHTQPR